MKTIVNKTVRPLRVPLPGGKVLHLGPKKNGQVADSAVDHPALRKLIEAGNLEVQGEGENAATDGGSGEGPHGESAHGHAKANVMHRRGQRGA